MAFEHDIASALDKLAAVELTDAEATALTAVLTGDPTDDDEVTGFVLDGSRNDWIGALRTRSNPSGPTNRPPATGFADFGAGTSSTFASYGAGTTSY
jgi:hypothetical protein